MKVITTDRAAQGAFIQANKQQVRAAMSKFTQRFTLALYLEFTSNAVGYSIENAAMFKEIYGMTDSEFKLAFEELITHKFLVRESPSSDKYLMYREPQQVEVEIIDCQPCDKQPAQLYCIRLTSLDEQFYKIGVTINSIQDRFKELQDYTIEIIKQYWLPEQVAYSIERELIKLGKPHSYTPKSDFGGSTECFSSLEFVNLEIRDGEISIR